jgi:signal transduction histidine kinase
MGELTERLPTRGTNDSLDRLVSSVNGILDKMGILLEELRDVGNNIAHDLRTPLARVRTRLERCLDWTDSPQRVEETIEIALSELDKTATIIAALLRIGEIENHRRRSAFASIAVSALVQELFEGYQPVAESQNIELTAQVDPTMYIVGDWHLITEALSNLIENALKFTPTGGSVRIFGFERENEALIRFSDTGSGIPRADQKAVFSRFYRGENHRLVRGSGLGLSLVHAICRLHGFSIDVVGGPPGCIIDIRCGKFSRDLQGLSVLTSDGQSSEPSYSRPL